MGLEFRGSRYHKRVRIGKRTVKEGECAMVWDVWGRCRVHQGPKLVRLLFSDVRFCSQYKANEKQYLVISYRNGKTEHVRGPVSLFENFLEHEKIKVKDAINVKNDECIIVYTAGKNRVRADVVAEENADLRKKPIPGNKQYEKEVGSFSSGRNVVFGPTIFFPAVNQFIEPDCKARAPLSMRYSEFTHSCSTKDNFNVSVIVSVRWKTKKEEVETFLDASLNPNADLSKALKLDLERFTSQRPHNTVWQERTKICESIKSFRNLLDEADSMGVKIISVQMEKFSPSHNVVAKENNQSKKLEKEREMKRDAEAQNFLNEQGRLRKKMQAEESERIEDMKLNMRIARAKKKAESEMNELKHRQALLDLEACSKLERQKREHQQKAELHRQLASAKSEGMRVRCGILHENGVDLTKYLIATAMGKGSMRQKQFRPQGNIKHLKQLRREESKECAAEKSDDIGDCWLLNTNADWEQGGHWVLDN
eukprot:g8241.t1